MNNAPPSPLAAPGPAPHPARALASCVDSLLATLLRFVARLGFLGRLINPQAAHIAHLLQSLSSLLTRLAAGDLPPPRPLFPATQGRAPSTPVTANAVPPHQSAPGISGSGRRRPAGPAAAHARAGAVALRHVPNRAPCPVPHAQQRTHRARLGAREHPPRLCSVVSTNPPGSIFDFSHAALPSASRPFRYDIVII